MNTADTADTADSAGSAGTADFADTADSAGTAGQRVCFLTDKPDHPLLAATAALLADRHHAHVEFTDPAAVPESVPESAPDALADVYLLKSHTPRAIRLARALERRGARVVNSAASTELCQDRVRMAETALAAGLPFPVTRTVAPLSRITAPPPSGYPFIVKSRANRRGDVVARVDDAAGLRELARRWPDELVVVQDFTPGDGWDHKLWVIAGQVFAGLRPSPWEPRTARTAAARTARKLSRGTSPRHPHHLRRPPAPTIWRCRRAGSSPSTSTAWT
ncbi:alpha-L-glutamate ligase [Streptomyces sp. RKAG293]|uniref:ATP-grasp domain-containing protein n=1 Tax=Streptomyces sp. RKAG293 TaxID=2893403 RepID=UPI0027E42A74|nr:alpha-L-glutamate ligase [Streptomyces sp. RKAG293]